MRTLSIAASLLCLLCIAACGRHTADPTAPLGASADADARWAAYARDPGPAAPWRLGLSLRFGTQGDTRRVTGLFWGNDSSALRLDVMAGVGAVLAGISQDGDAFVVFAPRENRAYVHRGAVMPLLKAGVPLPFSLAQLADLLRGRHVRVFGNGHGPAAPASGRPDELDYPLTGGPGGILGLDPAGRPTRWTEAGGRGWRMDLSHGDDGLPRRLEMEHADGPRATLLVKERETPERFSKEQLGISIPESAVILPLERMQQRR